MVGALAKIKLQVAEAGGSPQKLFGYRPSDQNRTRRRLLAALHPDEWANASPGEQAEAARLFVQIESMYKAMVDLKENRFTIVGHKNTYEMDGLLAKGAMANVYRASWWDPINMVTVPGAFKMARSPLNNDLMRAERTTLEAIAGAKSRRAVFISTLVESFRYRDPVTGDRQATVLHGLDGYYSLAQIRNEYPGGLDIRDLVWIWRRALVGLSLAHELGYVHGAILPEHIMVHPTKHEVVLVDWCYSVKAGETIKAVVPTRRDLYPIEVLTRAPATTSTDIFMLTKSIAECFNNATPRRVIIFSSFCTRRTGRPKDVRVVLKTLTDLIEDLYGPRKFRTFAMPR